MPVNVQVTVTDVGDPSVKAVLSRKVSDGNLVIALVGANGQQLSVIVDPVDFFHCIRSVYPDISIQ
jgi:hypothetical protein